MTRQTFGVADLDEVSPASIRRDTRPLGMRIRTVSDSSAGEIQMGLGALILAMPIMGFYILSYVVFMLALAYHMYARNKRIDYPLHVPISERSDFGRKKKGMFFLGNERGNMRAVWVADPDMRAHLLVFGTTGSGKTRFLLSLIYQALMVGSGSLMCDGKGDSSVWWLVFSFCRKIDRVEDLLVLNYLTGGVEQGTGAPTLERKTNTSNPCSYGSAPQIRSLLVGLMRDGGGDDMWKGRASSMLGTLLSALVEMRDSGEILLDISKIREYMSLEKIVKLSQRKDLTEATISSLKAYLIELPGYREDDALMDTIEQKAYEQHSYLSMQLTEVMGTLSSVYSHIFNAPKGEIDYIDVVFSRRILFVILPSLELDPDALAGLGKLVVAGIRAALAPALGSEIEGEYERIIATKASQSDTPFLILLDEYGYYSVKGFAVVAAQARSLGVSVCFASQNYASLESASAQEANACVSNTNIKIAMKIEDSKETLSIFQDRAGDAQVARISGHEETGSAVGSGLMRQKNIPLESLKRLSLRDLVAQEQGEGHVLYGDHLFRLYLCFADVYEVERAVVNRFIIVREPSTEMVSAHIKAAATLDSLWSGSVDTKTVKLKVDDGVTDFLSQMKLAKSHNLTPTDSARFGLSLQEIRERMKDDIISAEVFKLYDEASELEGGAEEPISHDVEREIGESAKNESDVAARVEDAFGETEEGGSASISPSMEKIPEEFSVIDEIGSEVIADGDLAEEASRHEKLFASFIQSVERQNIEQKAASSDGGTLTPSELLEAKPDVRIMSLSETDEDYQETVDVISKKVSFDGYAKEPIPDKVSEEGIHHNIEGLLETIRKAKV
ncbi:type IV secretory system conjugative DNA transfer family protein [Vibrio breoganii]